MPPPTWDDDFDFDDIDNPPRDKKVKDKKNKASNDDDFFDDDDAGSKLPAIGSRVSNNKIKPPARNSASRKNPYAENMNLRGNVYDNYDEQFEESIPEDKPKGTNKSLQLNSSSVNKPDKKNQIDDEIQFYEEIDEIVPAKKVSDKRITVEVTKKQQKEEEEEKYEEEFEEDYGEDFEEEIPETPQKKETPVMKTQQPKKKSILNVQPPKPPMKNQPPKRNQTIAAKGNTSNRNQPPRAPSRQHSVKSVSSKKNTRNHSTNINRSRVSTNKNISTVSSFMPNKYSNEIDKQFPEINLAELPQQKVNKLNDRIRAMIKRFNEELNDLINKNMLLLKSKKNQKSSTVDDKIRVLEEQKKNNETMIEYMERQFEKLTGREGELREEEYQLMTEKKIEEAKEKIKQTHKLITKLKYDVKNEGNKLTKNSKDKKISQELHHLKTNLIQSKKDEEKQIERIEKLEEQSSNLEGKISDVEYQLSDLIEQARDKGVKLESREEITRKFQDIKKRLEANRNHRSKLEHLLKGKAQIIAHEKEQLKIGIKNFDMEIKNLYGSIEHTHQETIKVVQKAKTNPKVGESLASQLQDILRSLEVIHNDNYSVRSESNKSRMSGRPLKNSEISNLEKSEPLRTDPSQNFEKNKPPLPPPQEQKKVAEQSSLKPNPLKKKFKIGGNRDQPEEQKKNEVYERVWKEEQEQKKGGEVRKEEVPVPQEDKKKPFSLKKNRLSADKKRNEESSIAYGSSQQNKETEKNKSNSNSNSNSGGLKLDLPGEEKKQEQKEDDKPSFAGPRMMKFKKRMNNAQEPNKTEESRKVLDPPENNQHQFQPRQEEKPVEEQKPKEEEDKPSFVPKRFNLRRNQEKKDEGSSYMPSIQTKKEEPKKEQNKVDEGGYKPKFDFGAIEDPFAKKANNNSSSTNNLANKNDNSTYDPFAKKEEPKQKITIPSLEDKNNQETEIKPKFNLRLRDRKKKEEDNDGAYLPTNNDKKQEINNPYAPQKKDPSPPKNNPYAPKIEQPISNPYNPYAQQQQASTDIPRKRQGPVKTKKMQPPAQKQKFNIYEQAEEAEGLNQFVHKDPSPPKNNLYGNKMDMNEKEPDLNDILGLNNKKKKVDDDFSDLLGGGGGNKKGNKKQDFFADMDL